jgi:hypothetical protein
MRARIVINVWHLNRKIGVHRHDGSKEARTLMEARYAKKFANLNKKT